MNITLPTIECCLQSSEARWQRSRAVVGRSPEITEVKHTDISSNILANFRLFFLVNIAQSFDIMLHGRQTRQQDSCNLVLMLRESSTLTSHFSGFIGRFCNAYCYVSIAPFIRLVNILSLSFFVYCAHACLLYIVPTSVYSSGKKTLDT